MKNKLIISFALIIIAITTMSGFATYNNLQQSEEVVFNAWADLESNLQRRSDLIPNLVATVKGYSQHESKTLEAVMAARATATAVTLDMTKLSDPQQIEKFAVAQQNLQTTLGRLLATVEAYPDLKANQNFLDLQHQLEGTENRINYARKQVNAVTREFNFAIRKFPGSIVNNMFLRLQKKEFYKADAGSQDVVNVKFD
jgi:LemA protein